MPGTRGYTKKEKHFFDKPDRVARGLPFYASLYPPCGAKLAAEKPGKPKTKGGAAAAASDTRAVFTCLSIQWSTKGGSVTSAPVAARGVGSVTSAHVAARSRDMR